MGIIIWVICIQTIFLPNAATFHMIYFQDFLRKGTQRTSVSLNCGSNFVSPVNWRVCVLKHY